MNVKNVRILVAASTISLSYGAILSGKSAPPSREIDDTAVIATVNTTPIPYSAIKVAYDAATNRFVVENGHDPVTDANLRQVEEIRRKYEARKLVNHIRGIIRKQQIARFAIAVSDAEVEHRWEAMVRERDSPSTVKAEREKLSNLIECLRAVHEESRDADDVYRARLADRMSPSEWRSVLRQYRTPEIRRHLEELLDQYEVFGDSAKDTARIGLLIEKLETVIEADLIRTDPEFAEYRRLAKTDPRNEKVRSKGPLYSTAKRFAWWKQRYREATVVIVNKRFVDAWKAPFD